MNRKINSYLIVYFIVIIMLFFIFSLFNSTTAEIFYVDSSGGADYTSIQEAINNASDSDSIYVYSGTYNENIVIDKSLILSKTGDGTVRVVGSSGHTVKITGNATEIYDFTIENQGGSYFCIYANVVGGCIIQNNIIKNGGYGVYFENSVSNTINDNTIQNNNVGIKCTNSDQNTIKDNQIMNSNSNGIFIDSLSSVNKIYRNHFSDNMGGNARDYGSNNSWDFNFEGNYWDDYNNYDNDSDGKGDVPYIIDSDSQDNYPLGIFLSTNEKPVASITSISPNPAESGQLVTFQGQGVDDGYITLWEWSSSINGYIGSSANIETSSLSIGTHTISFRVKDDDNEWSNFVYDTLIINPVSSGDNIIPVATIQTINPTELFLGEPIYFHGYGTDDDGYITSYSWRSSIDGIIASDASFTTYNLSSGSHTIYFKVKDNDGDWSNEVSRTVKVNVNINVNNPPIAITNGPYSNAINSVVIFDATASYDPDGDDIISYLWTFGDNKTGSGEIITHIYNYIGNYTVTLTVEDENNLKGSTSTYVLISETQQNQSNNTTDDEIIIDDTVGFEFILLILGLIFIIYFKKKR